MNLRNEKGLTVSQRATNTIDPRRAKRHFMFACLAAVIAAVCVGGGIAFVLPRSQAAVATPAIPTTNRIVPQAVAHIPLVNQNGQATDMAAFHGRIVIMADFMTSCQEECPITTGALLTVEQSLAAAHLLNRVAVSYTHLDVYKRQALVDAEAIPNPVPADMATATVTAAVIEAQRAIRIETPSLWLVEGSDRKI